ncbi:MAG: ATP-grasp domain-containing protein [Syntrophaceae bacterium]
MSYPTVLVLDGNSRAGLAVARSLGRQNCRVITAAEKHPSLASCSRFSSGWFKYPDPYAGSAAFIESVFNAVKTVRADILMPAAELSTLLVAKNKERFEGYCRVPLPAYGPASRAADKGHVLKLAESLGIPVPETKILTDPPGSGDLEDLLQASSYPLVVKPCRSCVRIDGGSAWRKARVRYAGGPAELDSVLKQAAAQNEYPLLLQEKVRGEGVGVFLLLVRGRPAAVFSHRRLREKPPSGGVSVLRESIAPDPELLDHSIRLMRALDWEGVAMVEFKKDEAAGGFKLMEVNGRFWGSLQLAINAGVDFPALLAKTAMGMNIEPVTKYRVGARLRWLWGDVDSLISVLKAKPAAGAGDPAGAAAGHAPALGPAKAASGPAGVPAAAKFKAVMDFLKCSGRDLKYEVYDREDPKPWLHETKEWLMGRT